MSATMPGAEDANTWTFRGYQLGSANFATAMVHFYRAEVSRANTWRTRLDATTNWAVITTAAALTFAFSSAHNPHFVLLLVSLLRTMVLPGAPDGDRFFRRHARVALPALRRLGRPVG
jgi:uncharacterized membrane protein